MSDDLPERPGQPPGLLRAVVLGGYGLIGSECMRALAEAGVAVTGIGRSGLQARRFAPDEDWEIFDIGTMTVDGWKISLKDVDVVVNASGALQGGARDDLTAIHETALERIGEAVAGTSTRVVQISAVGVAEDASTEFFRSKARGEAALRAHFPGAIILRPSLVLAPAAYGGTALLRAAASIPFVLPKLMPKSKVQCVLIDDLTRAVVDAAKGKFAPGSTLDVTGSDAHSFPDLLAKTRRWLGVPPALFRLPVRGFVLKATSALADLAGLLGWRSPMRSTAIRVLQDGVTGDAEALPQAGGTACRSLDATFAAIPSTLQERWFARAYLLFPVAVLTLAVFWIASGLIGLVSFSAAQSVLTDRGWSDTSAGLAVAIGAFIDIALGVLILFRRKLRRAALGMIAVSLAYLIGTTLGAPDLWADPLGPLVKVLPGIVLAGFVLAFAEDR